MTAAPFSPWADSLCFQRRLERSEPVQRIGFYSGNFRKDAVDIHGSSFGGPGLQIFLRFQGGEFFPHGAGDELIQGISIPPGEPFGVLVDGIGKSDADGAHKFFLISTARLNYPKVAGSRVGLVPLFNFIFFHFRGKSGFRASETAALTQKE